MTRPLHRPLVVVLAFLAALLALPVGAAQENPPPVAVELPCATNVSVQVLGRGSQVPPWAGSLGLSNLLNGGEAGDPHRRLIGTTGVGTWVVAWPGSCHG